MKRAHGADWHGRAQDLFVEVRADIARMRLPESWEDRDDNTARALCVDTNVRAAALCALVWLLEREEP